VEIDLLLEGDRLPMLEPLPAGDYYAFVTWCPETRRLQRIRLVRAARITDIRVPLKSPDADVELDLAAIFREIYDLNPYHQLLRYQQPVALRLTKADIEWAAWQAPSGVITAAGPG